jgi:hypothetical protein
MYRTFKEPQARQLSFRALFVDKPKPPSGTTRAMKSHLAIPVIGPGPVGTRLAAIAAGCGISNPVRLNDPQCGFIVGHGVAERWLRGRKAAAGGSMLHLRLDVCFGKTVR